VVKYSGADLDGLFAALADPTRRAILARLATREASVSELARPFGISLPGVHKHLRVLARAGLVTHAKHGRVRRCRLHARPMRTAAQWIDRYRRFWENQLDALATYLATESEETPPWPHSSSAPPPSKSAAPSKPPVSGSSARGRRRKK
jgi:DNA-binding transcriptional ArsR family regulator